MHPERVTVEKKKEPENVVEKRKKKMKKKKRKKMRDDTNTFLSMTFEFGTDACFLLHCFVKTVLLKFLLIISTWGRAAH